MKYADACRLRDKANHENKTIYFEKEISMDQVPRIDCQNFVKFEPIPEILAEGHPIEGKLKYIVSP
jgi:hypothetical protein